MSHGIANAHIITHAHVVVHAHFNLLPMLTLMPTPNFIYYSTYGPEGATVNKYFFVLFSVSSCLQLWLSLW